MKSVTFKKLSIQNFLSIGNEPVVIEFNTGLHVITGVNKDKEDRRNGLGKSTIADALYFSIFGSTIRDLKKEDIPNEFTNNTCQVILDFSITVNKKVDTYKIVRTLNPSKCYLFKNDEDITKDSIGNTTQFICDILSSSPDIFKNCVILTVNETTPFMAKKKGEKRKFIESIFNLEVFSKMLLSLRSEYNDVKNQLDIENARYDELVKSKERVNESIQEELNDREKRKKVLRDRKQSNLTQIKNLEKAKEKVTTVDIQNIKNSIHNLEEDNKKLTNDIHKLDKHLSTGSAIINHKRSDLNEMSADHETCPKCLRKIDSDNKTHINQEKEKLQNEIKELESKSEKITKAIRLLRKKQEINKKTLNTNQKELKLLEQSHSTNEKIDNNIKQLKDWNVQIDDDINNIDQKTTSFSSQLGVIENDISTSNESIQNIRNSLDVLDIVKFVVSEEGVKSYIVKKILQLFNSKLTYYLRKMDANCICIFNEYFEEEIVSDKGKRRSYFNFSGAERKNIDLACLFTFIAIRRLQGVVSYNVLMFDELLDTSLDEKGVQLAINIIQDEIKEHNLASFLITHRKEAGSIGDSIIQLEKCNDITRRVN